MIKLPEPVDQIIVNLLKAANTKLPRDIGWALEAAAGWETNPAARMQLGAIMDNVKKAEVLGRPMCPDTGIPTFYVRGKFDPSVGEEIAKGLKRATETIPLRPNTVDPLTRKNPGDNLGKGMPSIRYFPTKDDFLEISVLIKGAGSENMTKLAMLDPSEGIEGMKKFIINTVLDAGGRPCPPGIIGVGVGGTADDCVAMSKEALLSSLDSENEDPVLKDIEEELFVALNDSGLGPMGLGGSATTLRVKIRTAYCHAASLPVAVSLGCWATRRAVARITDTDVKYGQETEF